MGNKKDLADKGLRAVTSWMAEDWARREGADYVEVSALDRRQEVEAAFSSLTRRLVVRNLPTLARQRRCEHVPDLNRSSRSRSSFKSKCC